MDQQHHQPVACILPSNVPTSHDQSYYGPPATQQRPALQNISSNRRDEPHDEQRLQRAYKILKQTEPEFIANVHRGRFLGLQKNLALIISDSEKLWRHLWSCGEFRAYRQRQPKDSEGAAPTKDDNETKWPDHMEAAFCRALAAYPPMGRCKLSTPGDHKQRGRNELIAEFISVETGEPRGRKQVSSHIQVLKPYVVKDEYINSFLSAPPGATAYKHRQRLKNQHTRSRRSSNAYIPSSYQASKYAVNKNSQWRQHPGSYNAMGSNYFRSHYSSYIMEDFAMTIQDPGGNGKPSHVIHEFTSLRQISQLASITVNSSESLSKDYHQLAEMPYKELLNTQIISAESTVRLVSSRLPNQAELGIALSLRNTGDLDRYVNFKCRVRFYDRGELIKFQVMQKDEHGIPTGEKYTHTEVCDRIHYDTKTKKLGNVHFGSDFWAHRIGQAMGMLRKSNSLLAKAAELDEEQATQSENEAKILKADLARSFKTLTALQEISATVRSTDKTERLLMVCWRFEQCLDESKKGETTWRNIILNERSQVPPEATSGAMSWMANIKEEPPYTPQIKDEHLGHTVWEDKTLDMSPSTDMATAMLQPFDSSHAYVIPDFSSMGTQAAPMATSIEDPFTSQVYTDNDFDFTGGHIQLSLGQPLSQLPVGLSDSFQHDGHTVGDTGMLYGQAQNWQETSYPDPYFDHAHTNAYNVARQYEHHQDSPFSEAGAQQHDQMIESVTQQQYPGAELSLPVTSQPLSPETALRQHAYLEELQSQGQMHLQAVDASVQQADMHNAHGLPNDAGAEGCSPEHAVQSIEFASQGIAV